MLLSHSHQIEIYSYKIAADLIKAYQKNKKKNIVPKNIRTITNTARKGK